MDSVAQLALMAKAKRVFGSENTLLSFPVTPLAYKKDDLEFFSQNTPDDLRQSLANLEAFSTLVNLIPSDEAWLPVDSRFLWDEYEYVLNQATTASSTRTPEEEMAFQKAKAFLKVSGEGGLMQDSPQVLVYNQYRDAYFMAEQEYMEARSRGEATEDEAEKRQWREVDEPAHRANLTELEQKWILEGYKHEVEIAKNNFILLGAKSPILTWAEWKGRFNRDLDGMTSANDASTFFPSTFAPVNALEEEGWKAFKLTEAEVNSLVKEAPAELRARFSEDAAVPSVKSMSLEFSSATIQRSWFDSTLFRSRFWHLADRSKVLSDGSTPPSGDCPAYVTAIVFARKVVVEQRNQQISPIPPVPADLQFNFAVRDQSAVRRINPKVMRAVQPQMLDTQPGQPRKMAIHALQPQMMSMRNPAMASSTSAAIRMPTQPIRGPVMVKPGVVTPTVARPTYSRAMVNLQESAFTRLPTPPIKKPLPSPPNSPSASPTIPDNTIYVLAFICKPLPKCPDPDLTLQW